MLLHTFFGRTIHSGLLWIVALGSGVLFALRRVYLIVFAVCFGSETLMIVKEGQIAVGQQQSRPLVHWRRTGIVTMVFRQFEVVREFVGWELLGDHELEMPLSNGNTDFPLRLVSHVVSFGGVGHNM